MSLDSHSLRPTIDEQLPGIGFKEDKTASYYGGDNLSDRCLSSECSCGLTTARQA